MVTIKAGDKMAEVNNKRLYYFLGAGIVLCAVLLIVYRDITVFLTPLACFVVIFVILILPPSQKELIIDPDLQTLSFDAIPINLNQCLSWGMTDLGSQIELVIRQQDVRNPFYYFYISIDEPQLEQVVLAISQMLPFEENMPLQDTFHNYLRIFGLK